MAPKNQKKSNLVSHFESSDEDDDLNDIVTSKLVGKQPASSVESSTVKPKGRGRPRKEASVQPQEIIPQKKDTKDEALPKKSRGNGTSSRGGKAASTIGKGSKPTPATSGDDEVLDVDDLVDNSFGHVEAESKTTKGKGSKVPASATKKTTASVPPRSRKASAKDQIEIPETQRSPVKFAESEEDVEDDMEFDEAEEQPIGQGNRSKPSAKMSKKPAERSITIPEQNDLADELAKLKIKYQKLQKLKVEDSDQIHRETIQILEEKDKAAQKLITSLKTELKSRDLSFQKLQEKDDRIHQLEMDNGTMRNKIDRLIQDHAILSAKLETARNQAKATVSGTHKTAISGGASTKEFSQHKDNLYSDLCGLIVVNVKIDEEGSVEYDCLSSAKNGALHFKLQLDSIDEEEAEEGDDEPYFTYNPMLEKGRDAQLMSVLPPIFCDEMNFRRSRGVDFYLQLLQSLQSSK